MPKTICIRSLCNLAIAICDSIIRTKWRILIIIVALRVIENRIFTIRGLHVMFDKDLAELYDVKPIRLREQVKRNIKRFPVDFMFKLHESEIEFMVSQNAIPSKQSLGGHLPYVFTEQGVAALSAVLKSDRAVLVGIQIVRDFVEMRKYLLHNSGLLQRIEKVEIKLGENDVKFDRIFNAIEKRNKEPDQNIFFNGQIYDAYSFIIQLIVKAQNELIIIDNYVDNSLLDMLAKKNKGVKATIITLPTTHLKTIDIQKFNQQYPILNIEYSTKIHDRFLLIDHNELYHIGASLKDLGKKCFAFSRIENPALINTLITNI